MRQQDDSIFIDLLNNVRVGTVSEVDIALISSRSCAINNLSPPVEAIYLFAENSLKNPPGFCQPKLAAVANRSQSQAGGLAKMLRFKKE